MTKSRVKPNFRLFQLLIKDFSNRKPPPKNFYVDKSGRGVREIMETVPVLTKLRWAKDGRSATRWGAKFGSVISCFKVHSHEHRLQMIEYLRIEQPIEVDISAEEFIVGKDLEIEPIEGKKNIGFNGS